MKIVRILLFVAFIVVGAHTSWAYDDGDFQIWHSDGVSWKLNDDWKVSLEEEFKWGDNSKDFYYHHTDIGLTYSGFAKWLDIGLNYRGIFEEVSSDWAYENRPQINVNLKTTVEGFKVSNRSRMDFRIRQTKEDKPRYRNKSTIKLPIKISKFEIQPYVADEIFIDFDSVEMTRNRVYGGFTATLTKRLKAEVYYMLQRSKSSGDWNDINVLGSKLKFSF